MEATDSMADHGLNLHSVGRARLRWRSRLDRDVGFVHQHRKSIVIAALICGDFAAALATISCARLSVRTIGLPWQEPQHVGALLVVLTFFVVGLYGGSGPGPYERFRQRTVGLAAFAVIWTVAALPPGNVPYFVIMQATTVASLLLAGHYVETAVRALLIRLDLWGAPTVLVGPAERYRELVQLLERKPELGLKPIGWIKAADDDSSNVASSPIYGTMADLNCIRPRVDVEVAIFTTAAELAAAERRSPIFAPPCRFMLLEEIHNIQGPLLRTHALGTMVGIEIRRDLCSWQSRMFKRIFDILLAVPMALLALPVIGLAALLIKLIDPGPAFYIQKRVGRHGRTLEMLKLRTMYTNSERLLEEHLSRDPQARAEWRRFFKLKNDPRILPILGNFLRRSSTDELPQLWNVISGEMSLVGPRPLPAYHAEQLDADFQSLRTSVLPGVTGLWQVSSRSDGDLAVLQKEDLFYIRNWSPWLDFFILLQTLPAVLRAKGAR
jgi:Undecaprenyl-phosphate galactose phosphotransferase WbaP